MNAEVATPAAEAAVKAPKTPKEPKAPVETKSKVYVKDLEADKVVGVYATRSGDKAVRAYAASIGGTVAGDIKAGKATIGEKKYEYGLVKE